MPFLMAIIGFILTALYWWYRLRFVKGEATKAIDALGRTRGKMKRNKIKKQSSLSAITAIDDPIDATATIILSILSDETINPDCSPEDSQVDALRTVLSKITNARRAEETVIYARWAVMQVVDARIVIDKGTPLLRKNLTLEEKRQVLDMLEEAGEIAGKPSTFPVAKRRLQQALGF